MAPSLPYPPAQPEPRAPAPPASEPSAEQRRITGLVRRVLDRLPE